MIEISAPLDAVWTVLTRIDDWPLWQTDMTESALQGELEEGTEFRWRAGGIRFISLDLGMKKNLEGLRSATEKLVLE